MGTPWESADGYLPLPARWEAAAHGEMEYLDSPKSGKKVGPHSSKLAQGLHLSPVPVTQADVSQAQPPSSNQPTAKMIIPTSVKANPITSLAREANNDGAVKTKTTIFTTRRLGPSTCLNLMGRGRSSTTQRTSQKTTSFKTENTVGLRTHDDSKCTLEQKESVDLSNVLDIPNHYDTPPRKPCEPSCFLTALKPIKTRAASDSRDQRPRTSDSTTATLSPLSLLFSTPTFQEDLDLASCLSLADMRDTPHATGTGPTHANGQAHPLRTTQSQTEHTSVDEHAGAHAKTDTGAGQHGAIRSAAPWQQQMQERQLSTTAAGPQLQTLKPGITSNSPSGAPGVRSRQASTGSMMPPPPGQPQQQQQQQQLPSGFVARSVPLRGKLTFGPRPSAEASKGLKSQLPGSFTAPEQHEPHHGSCQKTHMAVQEPVQHQGHQHTMQAREDAAAAMPAQAGPPLLQHPLQQQQQRHVPQNLPAAMPAQAVLPQQQQQEQGPSSSVPSMHSFACLSAGQRHHAMESSMWSAPGNSVSGGSQEQALLSRHEPLGHAGFVPSAFEHMHQPGQYERGQPQCAPPRASAAAVVTTGARPVDMKALPPAAAAAALQWKLALAAEGGGGSCPMDKSTIRVPPLVIEPRDGARDRRTVMGMQAGAQEGQARDAAGAARPGTKRPRSDDDQLGGIGPTGTCDSHPGYETNWEAATQDTKRQCAAGEPGAKQPKAGVVRQGGPHLSCLNCGSSRTPQWRCGPEGPRTLCNACGVRFKKGLAIAYWEKKKLTDAEVASAMEVSEP